MSKFTVEQIKKQAEKDIQAIRGKPGAYQLRWQPTAKEVRSYAHKVLFLVGEIEKLRKRKKVSK